MSRKTNDLNIAKVMADFQEVEDSPSHRKGTFKIDKPFDEALRTILKAKPEPKQTQSRKR
jgi:hypothetical protein